MLIAKNKISQNNKKIKTIEPKIGFHVKSRYALFGGKRQKTFFCFKLFFSRKLPFHDSDRLEMSSV